MKAVLSDGRKESDDMPRNDRDPTDQLAGAMTGLVVMIFVYCFYGFVLALPHLFKLAVGATGALLRGLDAAVGGQLADSEAGVLLTAGTMWALLSAFIVVLTVPSMTLHASSDLSLLVLSVLVAGFVFGVICGYRVFQQGVLGARVTAAVDVDGLIGTSAEGHGDWEGVLDEGVILGEETTGDWLSR